MPDNELVLRSKELLPELKREHNQDLMEKVLNGALGQIPVMGSFLTEFMPNAQQKRIQDFCEALGEDMQKLSEEQLENVKTEEFETLFSKCLKKVVDERQRYKLNAYRQVLIGNLTEPTDTQAEEWLRLLDVLTVDDLVLLSVVAKHSELARRVKNIAMLCEVHDDSLTEWTELKRSLRVAKNFERAFERLKIEDLVNDKVFTRYNEKTGAPHTSKEIITTTFGEEFVRRLQHVLDELQKEASTKP